MFGTTLTLAASSIFALSLAAPVRLNALTPSALVARDTSYVMLGGDGTTATGWPKKSQWLPFEAAWAANLKIIQSACVNNGWGANNNDAETEAIKTSIIGESASSGIPKEFILAIMIQESKGCVRVPTTAWGFANPGLMQSSGQATCNPGTPVSPCPASTIRAMIHDGVAGEGLRTTLKNSLEAFSAADDNSKYYKAARRYNAGEVLMDTNNLGVGPTKCYASDIANRLVRPFGDSSCNANVIATLSRAQGQVTTDNEQTEKPEESAPTTQQPAPAPATPTAAYPQAPPAAPTPATPKPETPKPEDPKPETPKPETPKPVTPQPEAPQKESPHNKEEPKEPTSPAKPSDPIIDGAAPGCTKYYTPVKGDTCETAPIAFATLRQLNTQLNDQCTNLWAGYAYCIAV